MGRRGRSCPRELGRACAPRVTLSIAVDAAGDSDSENLFVLGAPLTYGTRAVRVRGRSGFLTWSRIFCFLFLFFVVTVTLPERGFETFLANAECGTL